MLIIRKLLKYVFSQTHWLLISSFIVCVIIFCSILRPTYRNGIPVSFRSTPGYSYVVMGGYTVIPDRKISTLEKGNGIIEGYLVGNNTCGCEIRIFLDGKYWTHKAEVAVDGHYMIKVPKGSYMFNGIALRCDKIRENKPQNVLIENWQSNTFKATTLEVKSNIFLPPIIFEYQKEDFRISGK